MTTQSKSNAKLIIMGSGGSTGVPAIGNWWGACDPSEPKNYRTRPSAAFVTDDKVIVIDTGADFRVQYNRARFENLTAVIYTHAHSDHIGGVEDLRLLSAFYKKLIPVYGTEESIDDIVSRAPHMFEDSPSGFYKKCLIPNPVKASEYLSEIDIEGIKVGVFEQNHGSLKSLGVRIGDVAYSTDVLDFPKESLEYLKGIKKWVIDGSGYKNCNNPAHACLEALYHFNEIVGAEMVYVTHLSPPIDYATLASELRSGFTPAYDGLEIAVEL